MNALQIPENESEYEHVWSTDWAWTMQTRDPSCGGTASIYLKDGLLFSYLFVNKVGLQPCYSWTNSSCKMRVYLFNKTNNLATNTGRTFAAQDYRKELVTIASLGKMEALLAGTPVWGQMTLNQASILTLNLYSSVKRNPDNATEITGLIAYAMTPLAVSGLYADLVGDGIYGIYIMDENGMIVSSTMDAITNLTKISPTHRANESNVTIVRESYAAMPPLTANTTQILSLNGYVVAYKMMTTEYGMNCIVVTLGYERFVWLSTPILSISSYFSRVPSEAKQASSIALGLGVAIGIGVNLLLMLVVFIGLRSIERAVKWLKNEQMDGTTMMIRTEDGELDQEAIERLKNAKYSLRVWFSEMHNIAQAIDELATNNNELKRFFPSVFVGMTKEDFARGVYKTGLRNKTVSVLFLDIVKCGTH